MKKIILAIFTVMLALAIFGCGKMQQASGGGGGSSDRGGGGDKKTTFEISGEAQVPNSIDDDLYASWPERLGRGLASVFIPQVYAADFGFKPLKNADVKVFEFGTDTIVVTAKTGNDGSYSVSLPLGKIYVVAVEKAASNGSATINIKNIAHEENLVVDVTPITSVALEAISQNSIVRNTLTAVNGSGSGKPDVSAVAGIIETVQENVENYYDTHTDEISNVDVTSPAPPTVPSIPNIIEEYTLTIAISPNSAESSVTVNKTPAPTDGKYLQGTKVKLTVQGNVTWNFKEWSGTDENDVNNNNEITMDGNKNITAEFTRLVELRVLDVFISGRSKDYGIGDARVTISPEPYSKKSYPVNIDGEQFNVLQYFYDYEQVVTITAHNLPSGYLYDLGVMSDLSSSNFGIGIDDELHSITTGNGYTGYLVSNNAAIGLKLDKTYAINSFSRIGRLCNIATSTKAIDGDPSDWNSDYSEIFNDANKMDWEENPRDEYSNVPGLKIKSIKAARDSENLYFLWEADNGFNSDPRYGYKLNIVPQEIHNLNNSSVSVVMWKYDTVGGSYPMWFSGQNDMNGDGYFTRAGYEAEYPNGDPFHFVENGKVNGNFYETAVSINYIEEKLGSLLGSYNLYEIRPSVEWWSDGGQGSWRHEERSDLDGVIVEEF
ncbi:hypothetical protein NO1_1701 [Candidatus Termititenax aidoneus]|uniref:Bacterial repeat domain-containing protein n=1 Tax=Termititenax aidoneus TaxID=2218524 RepID=A0A388TDI7_TERA1|nr:hypothetical protein NO1_1701 [Candidatus Termititenax aidoneus]